MRLVIALQVGEPDIVVEVVGAGLQDVFAAAGRFRGDGGFEIGIEKRLLQLLEFEAELRLVADRGAVLDGLKAGGAQFLVGEIGKELLRGRLVMIPAIRPEEFRIRLYLLEYAWVDALRISDDSVEDALLRQAVLRLLIVDDRVDRNRRLGKPVGERLLARGQIMEAVGAHDDKRSIVDTFENPATRGCRERLFG